MRLLGVLLVLVGCHAGGSVTPDDASTEPDGPLRSLGMTVTWNAKPALPGLVTDKIIVTDAVFQLEHLQLVSDAGADARTTHTRIQLEWNGLGPPDEVFPDAPVARYQQILLDMRSDVHPPFAYAYQIEGIWQDDGDTRPFRITDPAMLEIAISCDVELQANSSMTVPIRLDLSNALNGIDFKSLPMDGGMLVLGGGQQLSDLRGELIHSAFELDD